MSAPVKTAARDGIISTGLLWAIRACAFGALGISAYLAWVSLSGGHAIGCGPESGCDRVLNSKWAYWYGVPVSAFAVAAYLVILAISLRLRRDKPVATQRKAWTLLVPAALLVMGAALWFVALQLLVLKAICLYCMTAHAAGFLTGTLLLLGAPFRNAPEKPWEIQKQVFVPARLIGRMFMFAFGCLAVLIAGQLAHEPPTSREVNQAEILAKAPPVAPSVPPTNLPPQSGPPSNPPPSSTSASTEPIKPGAIPDPVPSPPPVPTPPPPPKPSPAMPVNGLLSIYEGRFGLDVNQVPVIGSPTNPFAVVSLFDYTCHHCRLMHPVLLEVQRAFRDQLVLVSLPMPLDPGCNQTMTRPHPDHTNACAYARLGLQVWRADRIKHHEFEEYLFTGEKPPALEEAQERARRLVGPEALDRVASDPWINTQLKLNIAIYELAYRSGQGLMPQLIIGPTVAVGTYPPAELTKLLADKLGLKPLP